MFAGNSNLNSSLRSTSRRALSQTPAVPFINLALENHNIDALANFFGGIKIDDAQALLKSSIRIPPADFAKQTADKLTAALKSNSSDFPIDSNGILKPWASSAFPRSSGEVLILVNSLNVLNHAVIQKLFTADGNLQPWLLTFIGADNYTNLCSNFGAAQVKAALLGGAMRRLVIGANTTILDQYPEYFECLYNLSKLQSAMLLHYCKIGEVTDEKFNTLIRNPASLFELLNTDVYKPQANLSLLYSGASLHTMGKLNDYIELLKKDQGESGARYKQYRDNLINIAAMPYRSDQDRKNISAKIINFLKELFFDVMADHGVKPGTVKMELCITGSLARSEATAYSDIDCFLIFDDSVSSKDKSKIQSIGIQLGYIAQALFVDVNQFAMDPVGLTIGRLNGTVAELTAKIPETGTGATVRSALNARSVFGESRLLDQLKASLSRQFNETYYFQAAIHEYPGPTLDARHISLKSDLIRTVDFLLQGFRMKAGLSSQDYSDAAQLIPELERRKIISPEVATVLKHLKLHTYGIRQGLHGEMKGEHDQTVPTEQLNRMVDLVSWLRGSLYVWAGGKNLPNDPAVIEPPQGYKPPSTCFDFIPGKYLTDDKFLSAPPRLEYALIEYMDEMIKELKSFQKDNHSSQDDHLINDLLTHLQESKNAMLVSVADGQSCVKIFDSIVIMKLLEIEARMADSSRAAPSFFGKEQQSNSLAHLIDSFKTIANDIQNQFRPLRAPIQPR